MPALTTTASMPPKRSSVPSTARARSSRSVTSHSNAAPLPGPAALATRSSSSGSRPTTATFAPRAAARRADSAPMPRAAPVMKTVFPSRLMRGRLTGGGVPRGARFELRADALVDQLDQLGAEVVGALERLLVDVVDGVGLLVVVGRLGAADRDRGVALDARAVGVGGGARVGGRGVVPVVGGV